MAVRVTREQWERAMRLCGWLRSNVPEVDPGPGGSYPEAGTPAARWADLYQEANRIASAWACNEPYSGGRVHEVMAVELATRDTQEGEG
ncbi:MAG TPA: hypothetical protein VGS58_12980 [Candidatus Sulfopaludibacter sp.]|nr:hypothetical protein [Candidatus Sulfopaludibacter sp.]